MRNSPDKILDILILEEINTFLENHNTVDADQFGFMWGHSTTQKPTKITNAILNNKFQNQLRVIIFLDLEKTFDNIYLDALIHSLPSFL